MAPLSQQLTTAFHLAFNRTISSGIKRTRHTVSKQLPRPLSTRPTIRLVPTMVSVEFVWSIGDVALCGNLSEYEVSSAVDGEQNGEQNGASECPSGQADLRSRNL